MYLRLLEKPKNLQNTKVFRNYKLERKPLEGEIMSESIIVERINIDEKYLELAKEENASYTFMIHGEYAKYDIKGW